MSSTIHGTTIELTRGDTFSAQLNLKFKDGTEYVKTEGDHAWFSVKKTYDRSEPYIIHKEIDLDAMLLYLEPTDTEDMEYGEYKYDIQLELSNGVVDTVIPRSKIVILEEVT